MDRAPDPEVLAAPATQLAPPANWPFASGRLSVARVAPSPERLRVLLVSLNFAPETTGIGKYSGELADALAQAGHEVRVVCAPPFYPHWSVPAEHRGLMWRRSLRAQGLDVVRCPTWIPARPGGATRLLHLASFALSSLPVVLASVFWRPTYVFVVAPALFAAPGAWLAARLAGAKAQLHVQDFELDVAFALGLLRGARARATVEACERWLMRRFDVVSTVSRQMAQRLADKGVAPARIEQLPNWVDASAIKPLQSQQGMRRELGIPAETCVCLFSGTINRKQGLETVVDAARLLKDRTDVLFLICGAGDWRAVIEERADGLANLRFGELQPSERLNELLNVADIHLLPQVPGAADLVMPSKLGGMLSSARPVVAAAAPGTEIAQMVEGAGIVVPPDDPHAFADAVLSLTQDAGLRRRLGAEARRRAERLLDRRAVLGNWIASLGRRSKT